jgi:long-chain acyl-CoA synthetase
MPETARADRNFADVLERMAAVQPEQLAVVDEDGSWTYASLAEDVRDRSEALVAAGILPGHRVALIAESSGGYLAAALAVWRAGAVVVTIYPSSSSDDLQYAVADSDPALIILGDDFDLSLLGALADVIPVARLSETGLPAVRADTASNPDGLREPLHLICFSSGTTSRPKAIMLSATAILNCARTYAEVWHLSPDDKGIVCLPMAWMYGLASTSLALLHGGGTVIVVRRARPEMIAEAARRYGATFLAGVANTFARIVREAEAGTVDAGSFASLRLCISGGEPRNEPAFERWSTLTGTAVLDAYCSSECLPLVTYDPEQDSRPRPGSAGKVVPRSRLRIVDPKGHDVATGETGEALSTGPGLMLGYWHDEAETAAALTEDGWFRTRDLVRVDEDGYVHVVGRLSDLIIRAGVNISPAEVERVLRSHPDVVDVAVVGLPDELYGQQVVAAVVPRQGSRLDRAEVEAFAREHLTPYKVPTGVVFVKTLALNANGKVSRRDVAAQLSRQLGLASGMGAVT